MSRRVSFHLCLGVLMVVANLPLRSTADQPVTVPVKTLAEPSIQAVTPTAPMMARPEPPPATLPGQRLPQYQMGYERRDLLTEDEKETGEIRFLLTAPSLIETLGRPLSIRVVAEINGKPFPAARRRRAGELLASLSQSKDDVTKEAEVPPADRHDDDQHESPDSADDTDDSPEIADRPGTVTPSVNPQEGENKGDQSPALTEAEPIGEPVYQLATQGAELLRRYAEATGQDLSEEEAGWLLTHWTDGPNLLLLHPFFQSFRSDQKPAFLVLDRDRDGTISQTELKSAVESFQKCDANRDQIVDVLEISKSADALRDVTQPHAAGIPLLLMLADLKGMSKEDSRWSEIGASLDADQNGRMDEAEIMKLREQTADIDLLVQFNTDQPEKSSLTLHRVAKPLQKLASDSDDRAKQEDTSPSTQAIPIDIGNVTLLVSAVQRPSSDQVSLGAVIDGYPLLPGLDPNDDGRFTLRELRELEKRLLRFDQDGDGQLTPQESEPPIRVCIALGALVHRELATVRSIPPASLPTVVTGPDWFVRMDRNKDNDLTRGEFPGNDEQFQALDADGDQLVSASEALEFDKQAGVERNKPES